MRGNTFSDKELIAKLTEHCIDNHLSKYTLAYPVWQTFLKRMNKSEKFETKVNNLLMTADQWWERQGLNALHDKDYNNMMWTKMTSNKAFTKDHDAIDLEEIVSKLEAQNVTKK